MPKYIHEDLIMQEYINSTKDRKIEILYEAIGVMQQYNGRSKMTCVFMAMGYRNDEGVFNTWYKNS